MPRLGCLACPRRRLVAFVPTSPPVCVVLCRVVLCRVVSLPHLQGAGSDDCGDAGLHEVPGSVRGVGRVEELVARKGHSGRAHGEIHILTKVDVVKKSGRGVTSGLPLGDVGMAGVSRGGRYGRR